MEKSLKYLLAALITLIVTSCALAPKNINSESVPTAGAVPQYFLTFGNPIISQKYTADPYFIFVNGTVYLYTSHDLNSQTSYEMNDISMFSSVDLVNWTDYGMPFVVPQDAAWASYAWAPKVVSRNGLYYLYFGNGGSGIGVVTSPNPTGPWTDPLGHALVSQSTPGAANVQWCFDPAVLIDDDGQAYLYFGGGGNSSGVGGPSNSYVIRLNSDMISVNGPAFPLTPQPPQFFEASQINKINGLYYFYYSTDFSVTAARIDYMISSNSPVSNFIYIGTILSNPPNNYDNNNHAAFGQIGTNWYIAYHNREQATLDGVDPTYHRSVCLDLLYFNTDGTIQLVIPTTNGVAQLSNLSPYQTFLAVTMNRQFGGIQTTNASNNFVLACNITNGCCIKYKGLNFGSGAKTFQIQSSGGAGNGGVIDIWLDSPNPGGTNIGSVTVPATGNISSLKTSSTSVSSVGGIHDLYLRFRGSGTNLFYLYSWNFSQ